MFGLLEFFSDFRIVAISLREMWPSKIQSFSGYISRSEMATVRTEFGK